MLNIVRKNSSSLLGYHFDKPDSMSDAKLKKRLEYHIAARQGPMTGLSSKWDYETGLKSIDWIYSSLIFVVFSGTWKK